MKRLKEHWHDWNENGFNLWLKLTWTHLESTWLKVASYNWPGWTLPSETSPCGPPFLGVHRISEQTSSKSWTSRDEPIFLSSSPPRCPPPSLEVLSKMMAACGLNICLCLQMLLSRQERRLWEDIYGAVRSVVQRSECFSWGTSNGSPCPGFLCLCISFDP